MSGIGVWWSDLTQPLRALGRSPLGVWLTRLVPLAVRVLIVLGIAVSQVVLFPLGPLPDTVGLREGMVAPEDVIAGFDLIVPKSSARLASERLEAERAVPPVFVLDTVAVDSARARVSAFFAAIDSAGPVAGDQGEGLQAFLQGAGLTTTPAQLAYLGNDSNRRALAEALRQAYGSMLPLGIAPGLDLSGLGSRQLLIRGPDGDRLAEADSIVTLGRFYREAARLAPPAADADVFRLYQNLLVRFSLPSLVYDEGATRNARMEARASVDTTASFILEGERIVFAHERVGRAETERLQAYNNELIRRGEALGGGGRLAVAGTVLFGILLVGGLSVILYLFRPALYGDLRGFIIVMGSLALVLVAASVIASSEVNQALIPIAFLGLTIGVLYDGLIALVVVMFAAALVAGQTAFFGFDVALLMIAGGGAAAIGAGGMRRRAQGWFVIAWISVAYLIVTVAIAAIHPVPLSAVAQTIVWGGVNATLCTALTVGAALPLLERFTGRTTDQTLLELSDLNGPLLHDLSLKAPGTYAHSINVANLAEAACTAIGANPILARVGAYYHDIGKMTQPQFFVENQPQGRNPHDRLPPARSSRIIRDHVGEGVRLASERRLPQAIQNFIREHHGTSTISFFLNKAREDGAPDVDPADFAYGGPKPQSRETGIVMLADAVESSARVLRDPSPEGVRALVAHIVEERIGEGQLDECPLTLSDLDKIKAQFERILAGVYHRRVEYPNGVGAQGPNEPSDPNGSAVGSEPEELA